jgi:hypothetical protein
MSEDIDAEGDPNTYEETMRKKHPNGYHPWKMNYNP